jgi:NAD(P)-dependent dehydrogenase (short-subunit alcohol dehydrogenase family)
VNGLTAVVTGTSRGFGRALADGIVARGGFVVGMGRSAMPVIADDRVVVQGDLTDERAIDEVRAAVGDRPLDLLVHNAAVGGGSRELSTVAVAEMHRAVQVNVLGAAALTVALMPSLQRADHPLVLNIGSRMGDVAFNRMLPPEVRPASYAYRISKAGVEMFTVALARELGDDATVLCVDPGPMVTAMGRSDAERDPLSVADQLLEGLEGLRGRTTGSTVSLVERSTK